MREDLPQNGSARLAFMAIGQTTAAISQAMADLNRARRVVDERGTILIRGERVALQVRKGTIVGVIEGGTAIPWERLRRLL